MGHAVFFLGMLLIESGASMEVLPFRTHPIYVHTYFIRYPDAEYAIQKPYRNLTRLSPSHESLACKTMVTCFFGFFRASELTVPTGASFDSTTHLVWGDVVVDEASMVRVFLKRSKTDQFGQGVMVFLGTSNALCPVSAILTYVARQSDTPGAFF